MTVQRDTPEILVRPAIAEFVGAFALSLVGVSAIITSGDDIVAVALAHGLAIGLMIAAMGHISGGHYNPAVSLGMLVTGRIDPPRFVVYVVAQLAGAAVAALIVKWVLVDVGAGVPSVSDQITVG